MIISLLFIISGISLLWISADRLGKYSILAATNLGVSTFFISSTLIAFGTSAPEMLTSLFAVLEDKGTMVIGNVVGSNIANLSLVYGSTLLILGIKKEKIISSEVETSDLVLLLLATILAWTIIASRPFSFLFSLILIFSLVFVILFWYFRYETDLKEIPVGDQEKSVTMKLIFSLIVLVIGAWLITQGAMKILNEFGLKELFVGYTVLAIGTSLPEIAASFALAIRGKYAAVAGTLIGSNIFNSLFVLAIPGLFNKESILSKNWIYQDYLLLLIILFFSTLLFCAYLYQIKKEAKNASLLLGISFITIYFLSLGIAFK